MLEKVDLERVFNAAHKRGAHRCEIYAETRTTVAAHHHGRIEDIRLATLTGVALRVFSEKGSRQFLSSEISTEALLQSLEGKPALSFSGSPPTEDARNLAQSLGLKEGMPLLAQLLRSLGAESETIGHPTLFMEASARRFEVAETPEEVKEGNEESAEARLEWSLATGSGKMKRLSAELARGSVARFFEALRDKKHNPLTDSVRRSLRLQTPWPMPQGELPILWSARAVAKLCLPFLRGFEGDLVLGDMSFLNEQAWPVEVAFALEDRPERSGVRLDHEGSPTRSITLFREGRPTALAVNNRLAQALQVKPTGHCRRESFAAMPTVGFWTPHLVPRRTEADLLGRLARGLSVHDIEVLDFDPVTASIRLRLDEVFLIHHGEEGEAVESVELETSLIDLLARLNQFSDQTERLGLFVNKRQQRLLTELATPAAISEPIELPGQVPASHYW